MRDLIAVTSALSDENRVRALLALEGGELCVCQIIELLQLAPSTVSKHMSLLRAAGLVEARKDGRWMYYRLPTEKSRLPDVAIKAIPWLLKSVWIDPQMQTDRKKLKAIKNLSPEELCKKQNCKDDQGRSDPTCCSSAPVTRVAARWPKGSPKPSRAT
jgi:ArsR family transcriptional regulator, arsenate/arsenite/antimonite-responsive transcriptional repressor